MKKIILVFILFLSLVSGVFAAATVPVQTLSFTPIDAKEGQTIQLSALVYNNTTRSVTMTVTFSSGGKVVATTPATLVASSSAKTLSAEWTMPATPAILDAAVSKAVTSAGNSVPELVGPIGTFATGTITTQHTLPDFSAVHGWIGTVIASLEHLRLKELAYFTDLYAANKVVLEGTTFKDVSTFLQPESPTTATTTSSTTVVKEPSPNTMGYAKVVYASIGKGFFARRTLYYVVLVLLVLAILRFIFTTLF